MLIKLFFSDERAIPFFMIKKLQKNAKTWYDKPWRMKGGPTMERGRRATYEERIEIVKYTLAHQNNYQEAADKFNVSYPQVYTWVRKYRLTGDEGLVDHRGRPKQSK